jgi:hypothetical protein
LFWARIQGLFGSSYGLFSLWCEPRNHMVTQPTHKDTSPGKPSKLGLIGVWHKDNLYLSTSTIGNGDPHPTNIDSRTRSIRMTPRRQLFFDKSFFISLKNHRMEIISPTHTHTHKVRLTRSFINLSCLTYMSGYGFIYTNSRLK